MKLLAAWCEGWRRGVKLGRKFVYGAETGVYFGYGSEILIIAAVAAVAAAATTAVAASSAAKSQKAAAKAAEMEAEAAENAGKAAAAAKRHEVQRALATFASRSGAMGIQYGEGSELTAELAAYRDADYDVRMAEYPYQVKGEVDRYKSRLLKWEAGKTMQAGYIGAGLSLLSSGAQTYASYNYGKSTRDTRVPAEDTR